MLKIASVFVVSYDTWLSAGEVDGDVEEPPSTDRPWKVSPPAPQAQKYPAGVFVWIFTILYKKPDVDEEQGLTEPPSVLRFTPSGF